MSIDRGVKLTLDLVPNSDALAPALRNITDLLHTAEDSAKSLLSNLTIDPKGFDGLGAAMEKANKAGEVFVGLEISDVYERWSKATASLMSETDAMGEKVDRLNAAMDPHMLKERVAAMLELEEAQKKYASAVEMERQRQGAVPSEMPGAKLKEKKKDKGKGDEEEEEDEDSPLKDLLGPIMDVLPGRIGAMIRLGARTYDKIQEHQKKQARKQAKKEKEAAEGGDDEEEDDGSFDDYLARATGRSETKRPSINDMLGGRRSSGKGKSRAGGEDIADALPGEVDRLEPVSSTPGPKLSKFAGNDLPGGGGGGLGDMLGGGGEAAGGGGADLAMAGGAGGEGIMAAAGPIGLVAGAAIVAGGALKDFAVQTFETGKGLAALANPATVDRFNLAMNDAKAVVGDRFLPVMDKATELARLFGDGLQTVLPSAAEIGAELEELKPAFAELKEGMEEAAPFVKQVFVDGLQVAGAVIKEFASSIVQAKKGLEVLTGGLFKETAKPLQSGLGMAAQPASLGGLDSIQSTILQNALSQGSEATTGERQLTTLESIEKLLEKGLEKFGIKVDDKGKVTTSTGGKNDTTIAIESLIDTVKILSGKSPPKP